MSAEKTINSSTQELGVEKSKEKVQKKRKHSEMCKRVEEEQRAKQAMLDLDNFKKEYKELKRKYKMNENFEEIKYDEEERNVLKGNSSDKETINWSRQKDIDEARALDQAVLDFGNFKNEYKELVRKYKFEDEDSDDYSFLWQLMSQMRDLVWKFVERDSEEGQFGRKNEKKDDLKAIENDKEETSVQKNEDEDEDDS